MTVDTDIALLELASPDSENHLSIRLTNLGFRVDTLSHTASPFLTGGHGIVVIHVGDRPTEQVRAVLDSLERPADLVIADSACVLEWPMSEIFAGRLLVMPFSDETLYHHIDGALQQAATEERAASLIGLNIIGDSPGMQLLLRNIVRIANHDAPVRIHGETGTGKELVARSIHYTSSRADGPFVSVNCGALNDELLLAELFGHRRGAFTGAQSARRGLVAEADRGTLFFDEIDSLSPRGQTALLRLLQEKEYRPVGSDTLEQADTRVLCATNRDLAHQVSNGRFREDLYYRLHVLEVDIPPLRNRLTDLSMLAEHFLAQLAAEHDAPTKSLHPDTLEWMYRYQWPGNIRELENILHRAFVLTPGPMLCIPSLAEPLDPVTMPPPHGWNHVPDRFSEAKARTIARFEKDYLHQLMIHEQGNVTRAAERAGKDRRALARLLKKHAINRTDYGGDKFRE